MKTVGIAAAVGSVRRAAAETKGRSERINVGLIGVGIRGYQLHKAIVGCQHVRVAAISDISDHYIERIKPQLADGDIPAYRDYRELIGDDRIDAVVIASPDHWHAQMTVDALNAGKDVYVEKPLTYSVEEAIQVRDTARRADRVTQVGYQRRSIAHFDKARQIVQSGLLGNIHQLQLWLSRNYDPPPAPWRAYNDYRTPGLPEKSGPEHVDWNRFQANRPARPYDPRRFFHWQCYQEYSTGIFGILMSHPLDAANLVMGLGIPETCYATGGILTFDDGRTVPDQCSALFNYPARKLTVSFVGCSTNAFLNQEGYYRGSEGTMELSQSRLRIYAESKNDLFAHFAPSNGAVDDLRTDPIVEERSPDDSTIAHLEDFFQAVQSRSQTKAPIEECFKAMVATAMAIQSYQSGKSVRWDADQERIVTVS